jgi:hypothetical protein
MNYGGIVLFQLLLVYGLKINYFEILICGILNKNLHFVVMLSLFNSGNIHARKLTSYNFWFNNKFFAFIKCILDIRVRKFRTLPINLSSLK